MSYYLCRNGHNNLHKTLLLTVAGVDITNGDVSVTVLLQLETSGPLHKDPRWNTRLSHIHTSSCIQELSSVEFVQCATSLKSSSSTLSAKRSLLDTNADTPMSSKQHQVSTATTTLTHRYASQGDPHERTKARRRDLD